MAQHRISQYSVLKCSIAQCGVVEFSNDSSYLSATIPPYYTPHSACVAGDTREPWRGAWQRPARNIWGLTCTND